MSHPADDLRDKLKERLFGGKVIQNNFRGEVVEEIVRIVIEPPWRHCSSDWNAWDFERDNIRIQVKQSARAQSWSRGNETKKFSGGKFAVAPQSGFYQGDKWVSKIGRHAQIFVLCWHPVEGEKADHFDVSQWEFFILPETNIGQDKRTLSVGELEKFVREGRASRAVFGNLKGVLGQVAEQVRPHPPGELRPESHASGAINSTSGK